MIVYEQYFQLKDDGFFEIDPNSRQISEANLYLKFQIDPEISNNKVNRIYVRYLYSWLNTPFNRFTDKMAVAWSNNDFELDENTFERQINIREQLMEEKLISLMNIEVLHFQKKLFLGMLIYLDGI